MREGVKGVTTPMDIANGISKGLAKKTVVAKVDGQAWDLLRPLQGDCALQLLSFEEPEGKEVRRGRGGRRAANDPAGLALSWCSKRRGRHRARGCDAVAANYG